MGRRTMNCGPPPLVPGLPPREALRVSSAAIATDGVAIVVCSECTVAIRADARRREVSARTTGRGEIELRIPHRRLARLGHSPVRYTLFVDGHPVAHATIGR